jgi:hypothetical protein
MQGECREVLFNVARRNVNLSNQVKEYVGAEFESC